MPPKKKPDKKKKPEEEPVGYNVALMTQDQLKQYARLLESEIEDMRRHCNFYQKMEDELVEFMRITEDDLRQSEDSILSKDVEVEQLKLNFLKHMREKRQWPKYVAHTRVARGDKLPSATCNRLEEEENRHLEETKRLKSILQEKDRQVEALRVKIEMSRREMQEENEKCLKDMNEHQISLVDQSVKKFDTMMEETERDFHQAKEAITCEAREAKIMAERDFNDACEGFKAKLHDYYKKVTKQDLDMVKKLKREIKKVEEEIESSKFFFQEALKENKELKEATQVKLPKRGSKPVAKYDANALRIAAALKVHNKTEKLALSNQNLEEQIKSVTEETFHLRRQFTLGLKKVKEDAERKVAILERKFNYILEEKENKSLAKAQEDELEVSSQAPSEYETISETSSEYETISQTSSES